MSDQLLRAKLIRLAYEKPELRDALIPLVHQATSGAVTAKDIIEFVRGLRTWFDLEESQDKFLQWGSREHVGEGDAGSPDIAEARRILKKLREQFGSSIRAGANVVDEWVAVEVRIL